MQLFKTLFFTRPTLNALTYVKHIFMSFNNVCSCGERGTNSKVFNYLFYYYEVTLWLNYFTVSISAELNLFMVWAIKDDGVFSKKFTLCSC